MNWKVKYVPKELIESKYPQNNYQDEEQYCFGFIDYVKTEILINGDLSPQMRQFTLQHELTHAFLLENGWGDVSEFSEEDVCNIVAGITTNGVAYDEEMNIL